MSEQRPHPQPTQELQPFWEGLRDRRFLLPRCRRCGAWRWPPAGCRDHPNDAYLANLEWTPATGRGRVFAFTIPQIQFHPAFPAPYVYALVELAEGPVMVSNVVGCDPSAVHVGMPVHVMFHDLDAQYTLPLFAPDASGAVG